MSQSRRSLEIALLRKVKAQLEVHGWTQDGDFSNDAGQLSLDGAFDVAVTGRPGHLSEGAGVAESLVLGVLISRGYDGPVADWNDEPGRVVEDIYELLDDAIAARSRKVVR